MRETADELVEKYTRSELIDLARERGIYVSRSKNYPNKMSIAEAMVRAAPGKPKAVTMTKEPKAEGKGVFAKKAAIGVQKKKFDDNVSDLQDDIAGLKKKMGKGVVEFYNKVNVLGEDIEEKKRIDAKDIAKFHIGVDDLRDDNAKDIAKFHIGVDDLRDDIVTATKNMGNGIEMFHVSVNTMNEKILDRVADINKRVMNMKKSIREQRRTNKTAVRNMTVSARSMRKNMDNKVMDMNAGTDLIVGDIHRLMGDMTGFVKEFYCG